ncbi:amino acid adenylation domain-containing protein [Cysteiniphilum halobium]|uniref:non-ribosomal peptide synthetase family protein n=1 Tax=Cysteiniphilum halobium TaxID=2219059 RepID=UPI003F82ACA6
MIDTPSKESPKNLGDIDHKSSSTTSILSEQFHIVTIPSGLIQKINEKSKNHQVTNEHLVMAVYVLFCKTLLQEEQITMIIESIGGCCSTNFQLTEAVTNSKRVLMTYILDVMTNATVSKSASETSLIEDVTEQAPIFTLNFNLIKRNKIKLAKDRSYKQLILYYNDDKLYFNFPKLETLKEKAYFSTVFLQILNTIVDNDDSPYIYKDYLPVIEQDFLINQFNNTKIEHSSTDLLQEDFEKVYLDYQDKIAVVNNDTKISYKTINALAVNLSMQIHEKFVVNGETPIGVLAKSGYKAVAAILGTLKAGCYYVPIDPSHPIDRQLYIMKSAGINNILADDEYEEIKGKVKNYILIETDSHVETRSNRNVRKPSVSELAYIIYTSGSTGNPKGVMIEHRSIVSLVRAINTQFKITSRDVILQLSSLCFDLSVYDIFGALSVGATLVQPKLTDLIDPLKLASILEKEGVTFWSSVPSTIKLLIDGLILHEEQRQFPLVRTIFLSGDWIPLDLPQKIRKFFPNALIMSLGGATEATVWSNAFAIDEVKSNWISIPYGYPLKNNTFYVLDEDNNLLPRGVVGELCIGGLGVARGYKDEPIKNKKAFIQNPYLTGTHTRLYRTGDLGRMNIDGYLEILGRKDNQVKIRGFRIELGEIEEKLLRHSGIHSVVICAGDFKSSEKELAVFYIENKDANLSSKELKNYLSKYLPDYMLPTYYCAIDTLPKNTNDKIDRNQLISHLKDKLSNKSTAVFDHGFYKIWYRLLGSKDNIKAQSFIEAGGNSLIAMQMLSEIKRIYSVSLSISQLMSLATAKEISEYIDDCLQNKESKASEIKLPSTRALKGLTLSYFIGESDILPFGGFVASSLHEFEINKSVVGNLKNAVNLLIQLNPILRSFINHQTREWETLSKVDHYDVPIIEYNNPIDEANIEAFYDSRKTIRDKCNTSSWPLFDIKLHVINKERFILRCQFALALLDGVSLDTFFSQLDTLVSQNGPAKISSIQSNYFSYLSALEVFKTKPRYQQGKQYWLKKMKVLADAPNLPMLKSTDQDVKSARGLTNKSLIIPKRDWKTLKASAESFGLSESMLLYTVFCLIIRNVTGEHRFTINVLLYNREPLLEHVEEILGNFSSTFLFDTTLYKDESFVHNVKETQGQQLSELAYATFDGTEVLKERNIYKKDFSVTMPVVFTSMLNMNTHQLENLKSSHIEVHTPYVFLDCLVREINSELQVSWAVREELFAEGFFDSMLADMQSILLKLSMDPKSWSDKDSIIMRCKEIEKITGKKIKSNTLDNISNNTTANHKILDTYKVQRVVKEIFQTSLSLGAVNLSDSFLELGGSSLSAVQIIAGIRKEFDINIPISYLAEGASIHDIVKVISNPLPKAHDNLIKLFTGKLTNQPSIFLIHAIGGGVLSYQNLSKALDVLDRNIYAIQAKGLTDGRVPSSNMTQMAKTYIELIKSVQSTGPYTVTGWSFGGLVAYEIARQLSNAGEDVQLVMIDTTYPKKGQNLSLAEGQIFQGFTADLEGYFRCDSLWESSMATQLLEENLFLLLKKIKAAKLAINLNDIEILKQLYTVYHANYLATEHYQISPIDLKFTMIAAQDSDAKFGWESHPNMEMYTITGDHYSIFSEHVTYLANKLKLIFSKKQVEINEQ